MSEKNLVATIYIKNGILYSDRQMNTELFSQKLIDVATHYNNLDMDVLCLLEFSATDEEHEKNLTLMKELIRNVEVPVYAGGLVKRFEDVKKYLYTGASKAVFIQNENTWENALSESSSRFGAEKLIYARREDFGKKVPEVEKYLEVKDFVHMIYLMMEEEETSKLENFVNQMEVIGMKIFAEIFPKNSTEKNMILGKSFVKADTFSCISSPIFNEASFNGTVFKNESRQIGMEVHLPESKLQWSDLKLNSDNMIPVVVQDYRTNQVLMLAYMNQEAFEKTIETGLMTYYSRSRQELWVKGLTSGHIQYVKELSADCDFDTLLAKVSQVGAACHTGAYSCFFNEILKKEYSVNNPVLVLEKEYQTILDRKKNPKEGSYTNYLFDKGLDKILKKVGEEAAEIIIAAKNPEPEEIKYEMADFLYHAMVMMVERGVTWEDITRELSNR